MTLLECDVAWGAIETRLVCVLCESMMPGARTYVHSRCEPEFAGVCISGELMERGSCSRRDAHG